MSSSPLTFLLFLVVIGIRPTQAEYRQPIQICVMRESILVGNHLTGTISTVRTSVNRVIDETKVADAISDIKAAPKPLSDMQLIAVADPKANQLALIREDNGQLEVVDRADVPSSPQHLIWLPDGRIAVSSNWARQITVWAIENGNDGPKLKRTGRLTIDFAPRQMCLLPGHGPRIVVAGAFGGQLALVSTTPLMLEQELAIPGHNVRGLVWDDQSSSLVITHQMLNDFVPTTRDHVFWGNALTNLLRTISSEQLSITSDSKLTSTTSTLTDSTRVGATPKRIYGSIFPLGRENRAAGDPGAMIIAPSGTQIVAFSGTHEIAIRHASERRFTRIKVGRRPVAIAMQPDSRNAYVANQFDDTLTLVDVDSKSVSATIPLGKSAPVLSEIQRGEQLFYDAEKSLHGWFSCHSCHTDGHSCGLNNDNLGDETLGAPKRIPSLLGTRDTGPWAWNGKQPSLESQIQRSLELTMHGDEEQPIKSGTAEAIAAYVRSLSPPPSISTARGGSGDPRSVANGRQLFADLGCHDCHSPPQYTSPKTYDVGLDDGFGLTEFNPPALRGVSQQSAWLHDGRAKSLRDVFKQHPTADGLQISAAQTEQLLAFLMSL